MSKPLVIVFVKNITLGKVKTRLAKTIGNEAAFQVYKELVAVTEKATQNLDADIHIYFSESIIKTKWPKAYKAVQKGEDLGERMKNAFMNGFKKGYSHIVLIGSDLPNISSEHINSGLKSLHTHDVVFGPAEDGGYYLIGLSKMQDFIFHDKPWSKTHLLAETLNELKEKNVSFSSLKTLNDIDTYDDLIASDFYKNNIALQEKINQLND